MNRLRSFVLATAITTTTFIALGAAVAAECNVVGSPSVFGSDMSGTFAVRSGDSCHYAFNLGGTVATSKIVRNARNGKVRMLDLSSFEYQPRAGFKGQDAFAIEATGTSPRGSGRSVVTMSVIVR